jgi:hypothetical protein
VGHDRISAVDDLSRITNATRDVATTMHQFKRADERLVRVIGAAREAGVPQSAIEEAIAMAARGRPEIADRLTGYATLAAAGHPQPARAVTVAEAHTALGLPPPTEP